MIGLAWGLWPGTASAQLTPEQMADMILTSARKAYNEKNYPFAAQRFREFVGKFGNHKEVASARYGLALLLAEAGMHDEAVAALEGVPQSDPQRPGCDLLIRRWKESASKMQPPKAASSEPSG